MFEALPAVKLTLILLHRSSRKPPQPIRDDIESSLQSENTTIHENANLFATNAMFCDVWCQHNFVPGAMRHRTARCWAQPNKCSKTLCCSCAEASTICTCNNYYVGVQMISNQQLSSFPMSSTAMRIILHLK